MAPFSETPIFSFHSSPDATLSVSKEPDLFDGWWTSEDVLALERRAIFSKTWICITHCGRFTKPGDYISLNLGGFPIFLILGKDSIVRAFHNVCRHRAYTITKKASGSSLVLGCRYHGWSYDTRGNLVKAPHFEGIEGFDKAQNSLFQIHTCVDRVGFVYVNLDAGEVRDAPDCGKIGGVAKGFGIEEGSRFVESWSVEGECNWKVVANPDAPKMTITPIPQQSILPSFLTLFFPSLKPAPEAPQQPPSILIHSLTTILTIPSSPLWGLLTIHPRTPTSTTLSLNIFTRTSGPTPPETLESLKKDLQMYMENVVRYYTEIKYMPLSPASLDMVLPQLKMHLKLERAAGREVLACSPRERERERRRSGGDGEEDQDAGNLCRAERICNELETLALKGGGGSGSGSGSPTLRNRMRGGGSRGLDW